MSVDSKREDLMMEEGLPGLGPTRWSALVAPARTPNLGRIGSDVAFFTQRCQDEPTEQTDMPNECLAALRGTLCAGLCVTSSRDF